MIQSNRYFKNYLHVLLMRIWENGKLFIGIWTKPRENITVIHYYELVDFKKIGRMDLNTIRGFHMKLLTVKSLLMRIDSLRRMLWKIFYRITVE